MIRISFLVLCLVALSFADVGPPQTPPSVTVHMVQNGLPETSITNITYHCLGVENEGASPVDPSPTRLDCSNGTCTNDNWYYKFNPCFMFPTGYFSYEFGGKRIKTENVSFDREYSAYDITIDAPTGWITGKTGPGGCSLASLGLAAVLLAAFIRR